MVVINSDRLNTCRREAVRFLNMPELITSFASMREQDVSTKSEMRSRWILLKKCNAEFSVYLIR